VISIKSRAKIRGEHVNNKDTRAEICLLCGKTLFYNGWYVKIETYMAIGLHFYISNNNSPE